MTSETIEPSTYQADYSREELEIVDLSKVATKELVLSQIRFIRATSLDVNEASGVACYTFRSAARALIDIKKNVNKSNWVEVCESSALSMSSRNAQDLINANESWLAFAHIPESVLSQVSCRTLARIEKADEPKRAKALESIMINQVLSEGDKTKILKKQTKKAANWDDLIKDTEKISKNKSREKKVESFTKLMIENIKLKQKVADLESQPKEFKAKV